MFTALHEIGRRVLLAACCCDQRCGIEGSKGSSHFDGVIVSGLDAVNTTCLVCVSLKDTALGVFE